MTGNQSPLAAASSATGSIYDLGYQRYEGARLGRRHAIAALFRHSLRASFGIGRGGRAKIAPFGLAALAVLPAIVAVGLQMVIDRAGADDFRSPIAYDTYNSYVQALITLFVAAQAPELLGRDQRSQLLSLYFSRALRRVDYALAKAAGLIAAILAVVLVPQTIIFVGLVFSGPDVVAGLRQNLPSVAPIVATGLAIALLLGSIGLVLAAYIPRRAYATAAIMAAFTVPEVVATVVGRAARGEFSRYLVLTSPLDVLDGVNAFVFRVTPSSPAVARANLPGGLHVLVVATGVMLLVGLLVRRYQRVAA
jgi:ABC-2 type transport system permease protein